MMYFASCSQVFAFQLLRQEQAVKKQHLSATTAQSSLAEMAAKHEKLEEEEQQLRTEKEVLFEHVTDLQRQVSPPLLML